MVLGMTTRFAEPQTRRWSREDYYRLAEEGWFEGQRVQLIDGEIIEIPPQGHEHAKALFVLRRFLESVFPGDFWIREEKPLNVGRRSDPEPDLAAVPGLPSAYKDHPTTALIVIEVADSSLRLDRRKAGLYASAQIPEYWIVNLPERKLEVQRAPVQDPAAGSFGYRYNETLTLGVGDTVALQSRPDVTLAVESLFT